MSKHPTQHIVIAPDGIVRFQKNDIIAWLCDTGKLDLNEIARKQFSAEDQMQLAQLLGYSVSGYGDLSYVSKRSRNKADIKAMKHAPSAWAGDGEVKKPPKCLWIFHSFGPQILVQRGHVRNRMGLHVGEYWMFDRTCKHCGKVTTTVTSST